MKLYGDKINDEYVFDISAKSLLAIADSKDLDREMNQNKIDMLVLSMRKHKIDIHVLMDLPLSASVTIDNNDNVVVSIPTGTMLSILDGRNRLKAAASLNRNVVLVLEDRYKRQRKIDNLLK